MRQLFHRKSLDRLVGETLEPQHQLKRVLGPVHLTLLGVGAVVGAGIFSMVGSAAAGDANRLGAGPAIIVSFVILAVVCALAGLCYAEFASMVPVSGSAYTYAYATLGELVAWIIGWDLILEYAVGNVAVAISWSGYFQELLRGLGMHWPAWLGTDLRSAIQSTHAVADAKAHGIDLSTLGDAVLRRNDAYVHAPNLFGVHIVFNLPAVLIVALITWILVRGIRESARFNSAMVIVKLAILAFFLVLGAFYIKPGNWSNFSPHGMGGIMTGAAVIFFAYIGFDAVSTTAEEARQPQRDLPIGILASLVICTVLYIAVAVVLTGMTPWNELGTAEPLATAFSSRGLTWATTIISIGALVACTSVLFVFQLGQPRIFFSMARDGLLPPWAAKVHPKHRTPHVTTILTGIFVAAFAGVSNIDEAADLCNIGTFFAFILVSIGIIVLRKTDPDRLRPFRTPLVPWVPLAAVVSCSLLMAQLPKITWARFFAWLAIGFLIYFPYSFRRSRLNKENLNNGKTG